jgi:hypothetical protein
MRKQLPARGTDWSALREQLLALGKDDVDWRRARTAVYVFNAGEDVLNVAKELALRGWFTGLVTDPRGIHLMLSPAHAQVADEYLADLRRTTDAVRSSGARASETRARYA